ncbi:hypothetical protein [Streptomyces halobius]|uniref:RDD family protein n=1 Tax=Streptomyces halobius TaxID=2879846 RepID=A0ABY4MLH2_9ACTN|nr:hypothetical protein [Streptomyces halobius]UQA97171.1 hypothetical protein K9S39_39645 [Streptomyces halobius]
MAIPEKPDAPPPHAAPRRSHDEATRLLCAGTYLDGEFRRRVIDELVGHEERPIAPSLGIDAVPVLAHALRARRWEATTGLALLVIWAVFITLGVSGAGSGTVLPIPWFLTYGLLCLLSWSVRASAGQSVSVFTLDRAAIKEATRGRLKMVLPLVPFLVAVVYWAAVLFSLFSGVDAWAGAVFPFLLVIPVWSYRAHLVSVMCRKLSRTAYAEAPREQLPDSDRFRRIGRAIDREQHAPLGIYNAFRPFVGAGQPHKPWSFAIELKPRTQPAPQVPPGTVPPADAGPGSRPEAGPADSRRPAPEPLTGREVIDLIKPQLEALRTSAAATGRDRLRSLEIDEFVYLPAGVERGEAKYDPATVQWHLDGAVGDGGEARRHFLRIRVGAWDEQVVVSLLVRVHTQGGMLVLEVVPHVLTPVRPEFMAVDVITARGAGDPLRNAVRGLLTSPTANLAAGISLVRTAVAVFRTWLAAPEYAQPDGPVASVRELGSVTEVSLFQEMDISRYVKTLQDRIVSGVREALRVKGYETGEFEQHIISVSTGGVFIGAMSGGAVTTGKRSSAKHVDVGKDIARGGIAS